MSKYLSVRFTEPQLRTIAEALDMLRTDYPDDSPTHRKIHRDTERVEFAIEKARAKRDARKGGQFENKKA